MVSEPDGGVFGDALLGADGTAEPRGRATYGDALALDTAAALEWGGFALPRLPVAPGADEHAARALVEADPLPDVRAPLPVSRPAPRPPAAPVSAPRPAPRPTSAPVAARRAASAPAPTIRSSASSALLAVLLVAAYLLIR